MDSKERIKAFRRIYAVIAEIKIAYGKPKTAKTDTVLKWLFWRKKGEPVKGLSKMSDSELLEFFYFLSDIQRTKEFSQLFK